MSLHGNSALKGGLSVLENLKQDFVLKGSGKSYFCEAWAFPKGSCDFNESVCKSRFPSVTWPHALVGTGQG